MNELVAQTQLHRDLLISYVYRITGSLEEAKDITQETIIKLLGSKEENILNPKAWMFKVATNLTFDFLKSAKNNREFYIGPWLPEPYIEEKNISAQDELEQDESLSVALLVILEKLSYKEKITYILHDIFDFSHSEISKVLNTSVPNSRQLLSRANKKLKEEKNSYTPSKEEHEHLTNSFLQAIKKGDFNDLNKLFSDEIKFYSDGGGKAIAARKILYGNKEFITKFLIKVSSSAFFSDEINSKIETVWFNGSLGIILSLDGKVVSSYNFEIKDHKIISIYALRNPDKLKYFNDRES